MTRLRALAFLVVLPALGAACGLFFPLEGFGPGGANDAGDAREESAAEVPIRPEAGCPLLRWPSRPASDDPGADDVSVTLAIEGIEIGAGDGGAAPGLDLDGRCTCPDAPPCSTGDIPLCDGDGGVDNGTSELAGKFANFGSVLDQRRLNERIARGDTTLLFVLKGYNGRANDPSVQFAVLLSNGTPPAPDGGRPRPALDGGDVWTVERNTVLGDTTPLLPRFVDGNAYVADGVLVARVSFPLVVEANDTTITVGVDEGIVTGRLSREGPWRLRDGRFAGRWSTRKLLTAVGNLRDPFLPGRNLCQGGPAYATLKEQVCAAADIMSNAGSDGT